MHILHIERESLQGNKCSIVNHTQRDHTFVNKCSFSVLWAASANSSVDFRSSHYYFSIAFCHDVDTNEKRMQNDDNDDDNGIPHFGVYYFTSRFAWFFGWELTNIAHTADQTKQTFHVQRNIFILFFLLLFYWRKKKMSNAVVCITFLIETTGPRYRSEYTHITQRQRTMHTILYK